MHIPFQFENEGKLILGIFHVANIQQSIPVVLVMCYGLNGNRVIENRIGVKFGEFLESNKLNLIRFDYRNVGVSEGEFEYSNLDDRVHDIVAVCNYAKSCFYSERIKIILIGFSDGARNVLEAITKIKVDGVIFWNPIFNIPKNHYRHKFDYNKEKLILHPLYRFPIKKLLGVGLNHRVIRQIEKENNIGLMEDFEDNILLIFGEKDESTKDVKTFLLRNDYICKKNIDYNIIKEANHLFNQSDSIKEIFSVTLEWLNTNYYVGEK